jgi:hypothetical protein
VGRHVEINAIYVHQTIMAVFVTDGIHEPVWIPKSLITDDFGESIDFTDYEERQDITIYIPEWFAVKEDLI